jgi:hypothetical protein
MGFLKLIFGTRNNSSSFIQSLDLMNVSKAQEIVQCYASILKTHQHSSSPIVVEESKLPYPKSEIKKAIITILFTTNDSQLKEQLKSEYLGLSEWQQEVGEGDFHYMLNIPDSDFKDLTLSELSEKIDDQENRPHGWEEVVRKDRLKLEDDLVKLGLLRWRKRRKRRKREHFLSVD